MALYKRPTSKFWWMKFYFDGELIQQSTKCSNKRDAGTVESAYRTQLALGKVGIELAKEIPTFEQAIEDYTKWSATVHSVKSQKRYESAVNSLKTFFGKIKVNKIDPATIEKFMVWRKSQVSYKTGEQVTRDTVNRELVVIKQIFRRLTQNRILKFDPALNVKRLAENDLSFHVITPEEERLYILKSPPQLADVATLMLETGMRPDEIYRMRRSEVFINRNYLQVTKGKTAAAARRIYLTEKAKAIISRRLKRFDGHFLFPQNDIDGENATKTLDYYHLKTVRSLGFDFRLYDCRHTFATRMLESDATDLGTLAAILGHSGLKMVMRYAHPSEERKQAAIMNMQNHISKSAKSSLSA